MKKTRLLRAAPRIALALTLAAPVAAHEADFKSPGPGMHFTQGQPRVVFAGRSPSSSTRLRPRPSST